MSDINELLKINVDFLNKFPVQGSHLVDHQHELEFRRNIRRLKDIEDRHSLGNSAPHFNLDIDEVIAKVRRAATGDKEKFSSKELRMLTYYLEKLDDQKLFRYALDELLDNDENWRYSFIKGLAFFVLRFWNEMAPAAIYWNMGYAPWKKIAEERRNAVCSLIREKLESYEGTRYKKLQEHADYFDQAGPLRLARLLSQKGIALTDAPKNLGYKHSAITQSFYSDVIRYYVRDHKELTLQEVSEILQLYNRNIKDQKGRPALSELVINRTSKLVLSDLVIRVEEENDDALQLELRDIVRRTLGDFTLDATWAPFIGATEDDKKLLNHAKELVKKWLTRDFIKAFFEVCVQDPRRKKYWLRFVNYVSDFRVAGPYLVRSRLRSSLETRDYVGRYFISIKSTSLDTAALVMRIRNKVFVEFSDQGRLYVYNDTNYRVAFLSDRKKDISDIRELKDTYLPTISETHSSCYIGEEHFPQEGSLVHGRNWAWEDRIDYWMSLFFESNGMKWPPKSD